MPRVPIKSAAAAAAKGVSVLLHKKTDSSKVAAPGVKDLPDALSWTPLPNPLPPLVVPPDMAFAQPFFSALERIAPELTPDRCWTGLPESDIRSFTQDDEEDPYRWTLEDKDGRKHPVFLKRAHLLDPTDMMAGAYFTPAIGGLPAPLTPWRAAFQKLNDPLNEAYVDALFALYADKMVLNGISPHWVRCYGTYTARAHTYMYDITNEYESLKREPWWKRNQQRKLFSVLRQDTEEPQEFYEGEGGPLNDADFEALDGDASSAGNVVEYVTHEEPAAVAAVAEETLKLRTPKIRFKKLATAQDDTSMTDSEGEGLEAQFAEFHDFPVQVTLLERATQTLEDLSEEPFDAEGTTDERWTAWLFQIIAALSAAQHYFGFVHNDLHSNNVMWSPTEEEFLYYRVHKGKETFVMKVPTYGKIMKIIDFGRASYTLPGCGFFISDAFYPGNDAAEQYNCAPFYDPKAGPKLEPNPSFDLCRLAVSLLDSLFPERPPAATPTTVMSREKGKVYTATVSPVYNLLWEWLLDDDGMSVLRTPDGEERYPEFDLYCALAADVHRAIPKRQIEKPLFAKYRTTMGDAGAIPSPVYNLYL